MCGIAGVVSRNAVPGASVNAMLERQAHRGPDGRGHVGFSGTSLDPEVQPQESSCQLGHVRLAILDLSPAGAQPMCSADGRWWITYNGEVYNYIELRDELASLGHRFHTGTDTEVVIAAWAQWGSDCLQRFQGMFAFALLDRHERRLHLARDFAGIKPLYWMMHQGGLWFSSEIKGLLAVPGFRPRVNPQSIHNYLMWGITDGGQHSCFSGVQRLPSGSFATIALDSPGPPSAENWWRPNAAPAQSISFDDAAEKVRVAFLRNVRIHLRSDVPIGAALSGGIDSSAVVMAIRHCDPSAEIRTFTFVAGDREIDEERWASLVALRAGAHRHLIRISAVDLQRDIDALIAVQEEPFASTSLYAQHQVFRHARESGVKVMLDGQGADELIGGYRIYQPDRIASLVSAGRWADARRLATSAQALPGGAPHLWAKVLWRFMPTSMLGRLASVAGLGPRLPTSARRWFADRGVVDGRPERLSIPGCLRAELARSFTATVLPALLRYEDRNSMAHSLESRVPFLTSDFAAILQSLPEEHLIDAKATSKAVFRKAMRGIVPDEILDRRDKIGFATPEARWLRELGPWVEKTLGDVRSLPFAFNEDLTRRWAAVRGGNTAKDEVLWRWLNLARWSEIFAVDWT